MAIAAARKPSAAMPVGSWSHKVKTLLADCSLFCPELLWPPVPAAVLLENTSLSMPFIYRFFTWRPKVIVEIIMWATTRTLQARLTRAGSKVSLADRIHWHVLYKLPNCQKQKQKQNSKFDWMVTYTDCKFYLLKQRVVSLRKDPFM